MPDTLSPYLKDHRFTELFRDELGWDFASGLTAVEAGGRQLAFRSIAQKRGFQVLHCSTSRRLLLNRGLLRRVQRQIGRSTHEHILIYSCEEPRKQVWQWSVHLPDGRRRRHREHPFFSTSPPTTFVARLQQVRFSLDEESEVTLVDALNRVRSALDTAAELQLFARKPSYAERSDELAVALQNGEIGAFGRLVELHLKLARKISRRLEHWFGMLPEDAQQIAVIGLLHAARKFEPQRGYQFSTYATWWVRQACQRYGPESALLIRIPPHVFWDCFRRQYDVERLRLVGGAAAVNDWLADLEMRERKWAERWHAFQRVMDVTSLSQRAEPEYNEAREIAEDFESPFESAVKTELEFALQKAIGCLHARQAQIIRMRYGLGCAEHTLEEVGAVCHITRERVRQIEAKAKEKLRHLLDFAFPEEEQANLPSDDEMESEECPNECVAVPGDIQDFHSDIQENPG